MLEVLRAQYLVLLAIVACVTVYTVRKVKEHRAITALGGYAPKARAYIPLGQCTEAVRVGALTSPPGLDIALRFVLSGQKHEDHKVWAWLLSHSNSDRDKTVEFGIGGQRMLFTGDPENIKAILATQFGDYGKGEPFHRDWKDFLGDGIFTTDGQQWSESRNLLRPLFIKTRVRDFEIFERHTAKLISLIGGQGQEVDISDYFYRRAST